MSFMQKEIYFGAYFSVDTTCGTKIVPQDVCGDVTHVSELQDYLEGEPLDDAFECGNGWLARMSAPGYMDCTAWSVFKTEEEANDYLDEYYGDDDDNEEDA